LVCRRPAETMSLQRRQICYRWGTPAYWSLVPRCSLIKSNFKIKISVTITFNPTCVVCFISYADVLHNFTICVAWWVSNERVKAYRSRARVFNLPVFDWVSASHPFPFQRCVMYFCFDCLSTVWFVPNGFPILRSPGFC
jgi:hypothetical protein